MVRGSYHNLVHIVWPKAFGGIQISGATGQERTAVDRGEKAGIGISVIGKDRVLPMLRIIGVNVNDVAGTRIFVIVGSDGGRGD